MYHFRVFPEGKGRCGETAGSIPDEAESRLLLQRTDGGHPESPLLYWAQFMNSTNKEELEMLATKDAGLKRAYERLQEISADPERRREYEAREKAIRDYQHQITSYWKRGERNGYDRGEKAGYGTGIQRAKRVWKLSVEGKLAEEIAETLGISVEEVDEILK